MGEGRGEGDCLCPNPLLPLRRDNGNIAKAPHREKSPSQGGYCK